jgi:pimeloyl-ACP methyl ester carboxylesterase
MTEASDAQPRLAHVHCVSPRGRHRMAYWEWGDPDNPKVLVCVHGLSRQGRDFDTLARDLAGEYRVICPDVVGRGQSDRLADPMGYAVPTYVADMVTLLAQLGVGRGIEQVDWVGTSMGGLIGLGVASLPGPAAAQARDGATPPPLVRRLVLNDVGPAIRPEALQRIGGYLGKPVRWATVEEAADALALISQGFGPHTREQWLALTRPQLVPVPEAEGGGWQVALRPGHRAALRRLHARGRRHRRSPAVAGLGPADAAGAAAARGGVRPAQPRHRRPNGPPWPACALHRIRARRPCPHPDGPRPSRRRSSIFGGTLNRCSQP